MGLPNGGEASTVAPDLQGTARAGLSLHDGEPRREDPEASDIIVNLHVSLRRPTGGTEGRGWSLPRRARAYFCRTFSTTSWAALTTIDSTSSVKGTGQPFP